MPKDHERNTSPLQEARKKIAEEKYNTLKTVLEDMIHNEEEITISRVCKLSRLSKSYLHQKEPKSYLIKLNPLPRKRQNMKEGFQQAQA